MTKIQLVGQFVHSLISNDHRDEVFLIKGRTLVAITALQDGGRVEEKEA